MTDASACARPLQRVLYIEDDEDIQAIVQVALEDVGGLSLRICSGGREALEALPGFQPDLVLLDVMMPLMDGPTTLRALRDLPGCAELPAVFMTARAQPSDIAHYEGIGALGVIVKPFQAARLAQQLRDMWRRHQEERS
ncbi:response regulator [Noviherbaspirillum aridicola]|uniref:Response regulator n=1 Tax=Noviherbaspirillum aridicola TaxID=2849687 RepID=A0ABQ4Q557_9BURK|nr:response regulator [Noviherbaspirillum aridicola]GIZ52323.1 response regulator [Noviherbaspirillum aridicola]